ncbi:MAG: hypothetical protein IPM35_04720 [Myxococcales bacterium]|nr:hypothetical protein [Myxococcales bacterium]
MDRLLQTPDVPVKSMMVLNVLPSLFGHISHPRGVAITHQLRELVGILAEEGKDHALRPWNECHHLRGNANTGGRFHVLLTVYA